MYCPAPLRGRRCIKLTAPTVHVAAWMEPTYGSWRRWRYCPVIYRAAGAQHFSEIGSDLSRDSFSVQRASTARQIGEILLYHAVISKEFASLELK